MNKPIFCLLTILTVFTAHTAVARLSLPNLIGEVMPSSVNISARLKDTQDLPNVVNNLLFTTPDGHLALGAGFIVSADGYVATNRHVVENTDQVSVSLSDGRRYEAAIVGVDYKTDVALLKIETEDPLKPVIFGRSADVPVGESVVAIGNPFGLENSVSVGIISARSRDIGDGSYDDFLQTDAAINQGNSGGPLFNRQGELIGINTAIYSENGFGAGVGFALPSDQAKWVIEQLRTKGYVERSALGVILKNGRAENGLTGLAVSSVSENAKNQADLLVGDLIVSADLASVDSVKAFSQDVARLAVGTSLTLTIWREGQKRDVVVTTVRMQEPKMPDAHEEKIDAAGAVFPYGLQTDGRRIVSVRQGSEAELKGIRPNDLILKINGKTIRNNQDAVFYINESSSSNLPLRLDLEDLKGEAYFVEFLPDRSDDRGAD